MKTACLLVVLIPLFCAHLARSQSLARGFHKSVSKQKRKLKEPKSKKDESESDDAPAPDTPAPSRSPTKNPTQSPTNPPTSSPTGSPTSSPTEAANPNNVFGFGKDDPETADLIAVSISVAIPPAATARSFTDISKQVAKVTSDVVRSFTPFRVFSERDRRLQDAELTYDEEHSFVRLAFHAQYYSWWQHVVAYKVRQPPEETEEISTITNLAQSSVDGAVLSGLFMDLLVQESADVLAVAITGQELEHEMDDTARPRDPTKEDTRRPTKSSSEKDAWSRNGKIAVVTVCAALLVAVVVVLTTMRVRRRRAARDAWRVRGIVLGKQGEKGTVVNSEWSPPYFDETDAPAGFKGDDAASCGGSMYIEEMTASGTGTDEFTAKDDSLNNSLNVSYDDTIDDRSLHSFT